MKRKHLEETRYQKLSSDLKVLCYDVGLYIMSFLLKSCEVCGRAVGGQVVPFFKVKDAYYHKKLKKHIAPMYQLEFGKHYVCKSCIFFYRASILFPKTVNHKLCIHLAHVGFLSREILGDDHQWFSVYVWHVAKEYNRCLLKYLRSDDSFYEFSSIRRILNLYKR